MYLAWSGQWENQVRTKKRLQFLVLLGILIIFILLYFTFHSALEASMAATAMKHNHGAMHEGHGSQMAQAGKVAYPQVVDGVKVTFRVMDMKQQMKGMEMPGGMKETHHLMSMVEDVKTGKAITGGVVRVKVAGPDKSDQTKDLMGMKGNFGNDFDLSKKGNYGIMVKFKLADNKVRNVKFWYTV